MIGSLLIQVCERGSRVHHAKQTFSLLFLLMPGLMIGDTERAGLLLLFQFPSLLIELLGLLKPLKFFIGKFFIWSGRIFCGRT